MQLAKVSTSSVNWMSEASGILEGARESASAEI